MEVEVIAQRKFNDKGIIRESGDKYHTSTERANELIKSGAVVIVDEIKTNPNDESVKENKKITNKKAEKKII